MARPIGLSLKIESTDISPYGWKVTLEGVDISNGLRDLTLRLSDDNVTEAEITLRVGGVVEVDARALAILTAHAEAA